MFDPHKLDISDEFRQVVQCFRGSEDKVRVLLNKSDQVDALQLSRVMGTLMWQLGEPTQGQCHEFVWLLMSAPCAFPANHQPAACGTLRPHVSSSGRSAGSPWVPTWPSSSSWRRSRRSSSAT